MLSTSTYKEVICLMFEMKRIYRAPLVLSHQSFVFETCASDPYDHDGDNDCGGKGTDPNNDPPPIG